MPQIQNVTVTNTNTGVNWVTGEQATAPDTPFPATFNVRVNAAADNQPPVGIFNNPQHNFVVQGQYVASAQNFNSGPLRINPNLTDPPNVYVFRT